MNAIAKAIDAINEVFGRIIAPLIAIITLIVLYDIVSRFFSAAQATGRSILRRCCSALTLCSWRLTGCVITPALVDVVKRLLSRKQAVLDLIGYLVFLRAVYLAAADLRLALLRALL